jgi:hypothetical protein
MYNAANYTGGPYAGCHITGKDILIVSQPNASVFFPALVDYGHVSNTIPFSLTIMQLQLIAYELLLLPLGLTARPPVFA